MREEEKESWEEKLLEALDKHITKRGGMYYFDQASIVKYIKNLLQAQRAELLEKLPKEMPDDVDEALFGTPRMGFNYCLSEVKKIVDNS